MTAMDVKQRQEMVSSVINRIVNAAAEKAQKKEIPLHSLFVTGSYASWLRDPEGLHHPSWESIPDVNLYACIDGDETDLLAMESVLGESAADTSAGMETANLILDLHPFALTSGEVRPSKVNIQLTLRVLNLAQPGRWPDYSWAGWMSNYVALYPAGRYPFNDLVPPKPERNAVWLRHMYLALCSYGNILHMLALSGFRFREEYLFDEAFRYLKEISKDGFGLGVPLDHDESVDITAFIAQWRYKSVDFYKKYYGTEAAAVIEEFVRVENNYFSQRSTKRANELLESAIRLRGIVFEKGFLRRLKEWESRNRLNGREIFSVMPLWY
jgi:hypothetical protein